MLLFPMARGNFYSHYTPYPSSPDLTWRDVQYLLVYTSDSSRLIDSWATNAAGLRFSHKHGFGAVDAEALVTRGKHWINVPPQITSSVLSTPLSV